MKVDFDLLFPVELRSDYNSLCLSPLMWRPVGTSRRVCISQTPTSGFNPPTFGAWITLDWIGNTKIEFSHIYTFTCPLIAAKSAASEVCSHFWIEPQSPLNQQWKWILVCFCLSCVLNIIPCISLLTCADKKSDVSRWQLRFFVGKASWLEYFAWCLEQYTGEVLSCI